MLEGGHASLCVPERAAHCAICLVNRVGDAVVKFSGDFFFFVILFEPEDNIVFVLLKLELQ